MPQTDYVICNQAGSMLKCKGCPFAKPRATKMACPYGKINYAITKFIGVLTYNHKSGKWGVTLNGQEIPGLVPGSKFHKLDNRNKQMVFWVTEFGIYTFRHLAKVSTHH